MSNPLYNSGSFSLARYLDPKGLTPLEKAIQVVEQARPNTPEYNPRLIELRNLLKLAQENFDRAKIAEYEAGRARETAEIMLRDIQVQIEVLAEDLGLTADEHESGEVSA